MVAGTRRALLGAGAAAALGAAGCGGRTPDRPASDAGVLEGVLAVERELIAAWRAVAVLPGAEGNTARAVLAHERAHVRALEAARSASTRVAPPDASPGAATAPPEVSRAARAVERLAGAGDARAALDAAGGLARAAAATHVAALGDLRDPEARALVMALAGAAAQHTAVVALALGREPLPDAFAGTLGA